MEEWQHSNAPCTPDPAHRFRRLQIGQRVLPKQIRLVSIGKEHWCGANLAERSFPAPKTWVEFTEYNSATVYREQLCDVATLKDPSPATTCINSWLIVFIALVRPSKFGYLLIPYPRKALVPGVFAKAKVGRTWCTVTMRNDLRRHSIPQRTNGRLISLSMNHITRLHHCHRLDYVRFETFNDLLATLQTPALTRWPAELL